METKLEFYQRQFRDRLTLIPHSPKDTLPLLEKVAARLSEIKRVSPCEITDEDIGRIFDEFVNLRNDATLEPDLISCLFATVYKLLEIKYRFKSYNYKCCTYENGWAGGHRYKSSIVVLSCLNRPMEMSILRNEEAFFVCMSVLNEKYKYCIRLIPGSMVPTYLIENKKSDLDKIVYIDTTISDIYQKFCLKVILNKFRSTEKSHVYWNSLPSNHETDKFNGLKRQKVEFWKMNKKQLTSTPTTGGASTTSTCTESTDEPISYGPYGTLCKILTENPDCKPSEMARFFAVVHNSLVGWQLCSCTSSTPFEYNWPGGPRYDSKVIKYDHQSHILNVSVLANDEEYFLCISFVDDKSKYRVKKILKAFGPTFDPKTFSSDQHKMSVINIWIMSFFREFVDKDVRRHCRSNQSSRCLNRDPSVANKTAPTLIE